MPIMRGDTVDDTNFYITSMAWYHKYEQSLLQNDQLAPIRNLYYNATNHVRAPCEMVVRLEMMKTSSHLDRTFRLLALEFLLILV